MMVMMMMVMVALFHPGCEFRGLAKWLDVNRGPRCEA